MIKKFFALLTMSMLLFVGTIAGSGPAYAAPGDQLVLTSDYTCSEEPALCDMIDFSVKMNQSFGYENGNDEEYFNGNWELFNASGKKVDSGDLQSSDGYFTGFITGQNYGKPYPNGKYTLRLKSHLSYLDDCGWQWSSYSGDFYNLCDGDDYVPTPDKTEYLTYSFNWAGKSLKTNRLSFTASQKVSATTATTYTAAKSASHTATASYTAKEKATYRYKSKTYTATASKTTKKTHKVTKQGSYKANKLKRTATVTAKFTSYHSDADAKKRAAAKATTTAKTLATNNAKAYANGQATLKAKASLTSKVKSAAYAIAKKKITAKVKADTKKSAKAAALRAAKKKAGH